MRMYTCSKKGLLFTLGGVILLAACLVAGTTVRPVQSSVRLLPIYSVDTPEKTVSVTFDCAWEDADTDAILAVLDAYGVKATFFVTGDFVDRCGGSVKRFYDAGHEIGNHSDTHPHPNRLSKEALSADTEACSEKIKALTGTKPTLYRAPYGEFNNRVVETVGALGYACIQWDCDSIDYENPNTQTMLKRITKRVQNGSILLFHTGTEHTAAALGDIFAALQAQGYTFKPVGQMIYKDGYVIDANGRQKKKEV